jgi:hypothetical protein
MLYRVVRANPGKRRLQAPAGAACGLQNGRKICMAAGTLHGRGYYFFLARARQIRQSEGRQRLKTYLYDIII